MPTWGELLQELETINRAFQQQYAPLLMQGVPLPVGTPSPHDVLRRKYLAEFSKLTGRATIVYETGFLEARPVDPAAVSLHLGDVAGFMEACSNIKEKQVDLFLHSPGGQAEATESIVKYLRSRFRHIRVIVPHAAMSAATMLALAADEIIMGQHSQLGPIDPQFNLQTPEGARGAPGQAILDQFEQAKLECKDPNNLAAWLPTLRMYGPGLIANIKHQHALAQELVAGWLEAYMFRGRAKAHDRATAAASWFADFKQFRSHGRPVHRDDVKKLGLRIIKLERNADFQDAALSVHHAVQLTLGGTGAVKIIENHHGRAFIRTAQMINMPVPMRPPVQGPIPPQPPGQLQ